MEGDKRDVGLFSEAGDAVKRFFRQFDKNGNGLISFTEFSETLKDMNIDISDEDSKTLFMRFDSHLADGNIDLSEFMEFFSGHLQDKANGVNIGLKPDNRPIQFVIATMKNVLLPTVQALKAEGLGSLDEFLARGAASHDGLQPLPTSRTRTPRPDAIASATAAAAPATNIPESTVPEEGTTNVPFASSSTGGIAQAAAQALKSFVLAPSALFQDIHQKSADANSEKLRKLGERNIFKS